MTVPNICKELEQLGAHLCGSRAMAEIWPSDVIISEETDWDYAIQDGAISEDKILALGFYKVDLANNGYCDDLLISMYLHKEIECQLLVRSDIETYLKAMNSITIQEWLYRLWKSSPHLNVKKEDRGWFRAQVRDYFNRKFKELSPSINDDLPF